jgi:hypothetical protein
MANEFIIRKGFISKANSGVSGSLNVSSSVVASAYYGDGRNLFTTTSYNPSISDSISMADDHGGLTSGTTVGDLRGSSYDDLFTDILFPTVLAYIQTAKSVTVTGITTETIEIGSTITPSVITTFNPGLINNGDDTSGPDLVGDPNLYTYKLPGGTTDGTVVSTTSPNNYTYTSSYEVIAGSNIWSVVVSHDAGTGTYTDNKGVDGTNLDGSRVSATVVRNMSTKTGRYYAWDGYGASGSAPTDSTGVRAITSKRFLSSTNTGTFNITIPIGTPEVYFFTPAGKTVTVLYVESSNADVTGTFTETQFNVNDAGGNTVSYDSWVSYIGATGYPSTATYNVTIS